MKVFTLGNGLQCCLLQRPDTAMATVNILYNVGSRDEQRSCTGLAHLFEHLMFGGSVHVPSFDRVLEGAGGSSNAWTSTDFTNFYDELPAANIETALYLESDRMLQLDFSQHALDVQRSVVVEEFKQTHLNRPYGDASHRLRAMLYDPSHPYSWPTIGLVPEHIKNVTLGQIKDWYYSHYAPNNAFLSIVAPQSEKELERLVRRWFGDLPARQIKPRSLPEPGTFAGSREETVVDPSVPQPFISKAYRMEPYGTKGYYAADILTDILAAGRAERLWRNLVDRRGSPFTTVDASIVGSEHEGMLLLTALLDPGIPSGSISAAQAELEEQFRLLAQAGQIKRHELQRVQNNFESTYAFEGVSARRMAARLAQALCHGEKPDDVIARRREITLDDLASTASDVSSAPQAALIYTATR